MANKTRKPNGKSSHQSNHQTLPPAQCGGFYFNSSHPSLNFSNFPALPSTVGQVLTVVSPLSFLIGTI